MKPPARADIRLIGFMASGKSSVGRSLARRLKRPFLDLDTEIERMSGCSVSRLFKEKGEPAFRSLETRALRKLSGGRGRVAALGGGAVLAKGNASLARRNAVVIYLQTPLETLLRRGEKDRRTRPLWKGATRTLRRKALSRLLRTRRGKYAAAAHIAIRTGRATPEAVARRIEKRILQEFPIAVRGQKGKNIGG